MPAKTRLSGIPVRLGTCRYVTTVARWAVHVPQRSVGRTNVGLDLNALPVDFDAPAAPDLVLELSRGETRRVAFALVPLGGIRGRVVEDANRNGQADPEEAGDRRRGAHARRRIAIGARAQRRVPLRRGARRRPSHRAAEGIAARRRHRRRRYRPDRVDYARTPAERPDVSRRDREAAGSAQGLSAAHWRERTWPGQQRDACREAGAAFHGSGTYGPDRGVRTGPSDAGLFTIQVAALSDSSRAHKLVDGLKDSGFDAYLVEPGAADPHGPYRVRVGRYGSREVALVTVTRLEAQMGAKPWLTTVTGR